MAEPTFSEKMLARYESLLLEAAGLRSVTVEGQTVSYDQLLEGYNYWKRQVAKEQATKPVIVPVQMNGV